MLSLSRNEAVPLKTMRAGMPWDWETFPEFLDSVGTHAQGRQRDVARAAGSALRLRRRRGQGQGGAGVSDEELEQMCELLVEAMEAGGCGWSSQITGDSATSSATSTARPMVTDEMTEREIVAFSTGAAPPRPGHDPDHRPPRDRGAHRPRERPPDHLERPGADGFGQPARREPLPAPRDDRATRRTEPGGGRAGLRLGTDCSLQVRDRLRGLQPHGHLPGLAARRRSAPSRRRSAKLADPERRPALKEAIDYARRRLRRWPATLGRDDGELDLERRPERSGAQGALRGVQHRRDRGPGRQGPRSTPCSTSPWPPASTPVSAQR